MLTSPLFVYWFALLLLFSEALYLQLKTKVLKDKGICFSPPLPSLFRVESLETLPAHKELHNESTILIRGEKGLLNISQSYFNHSPPASFVFPVIFLFVFIRAFLSFSSTA